jgi:hypothetical protein
MDEEVVAVFIPIIAIFMSLLIPIVFAITDYKRRRDIVEANHKERLAAIDRGMEIPPLPESFYLSMKPARRSSYLLPGLIWLFVGIGLFVRWARWPATRFSTSADPGRRRPGLPDLLFRRGP